MSSSLFNTFLLSAVQIFIVRQEENLFAASQQKHAYVKIVGLLTQFITGRPPPRSLCSDVRGGFYYPLPTEELIFYLSVSRITDWTRKGVAKENPLNVGADSNHGSHTRMVFPDCR